MALVYKEIIPGTYNTIKSHDFILSQLTDYQSLGKLKDLEERVFYAFSNTAYSHFQNDTESESKHDFWS